MRIWLLFALLSLPLIAQAATLNGRIIGVADGDTVTLLDSSRTQFKIRLSGIDAPEKAQPFGDVSKQSLSKMVYKKTVTVDYDKQDRYGRTVGKIVLDGRDINLEQIHRGLAWHYKKYMNEQSADDRLEYARSEEVARQQPVGLWKHPNPQPPWEWRKSKRYQHQQ